jgi:uncharacterized ferritin-like protein (DUF455 family)
MTQQGIRAAACQVLRTAGAACKAQAAQALACRWRAGALLPSGPGAPPQRPARPAQPPLVPPREVRKRKVGAAREGRVALLHALAHIELNAIDLAADLLARFAAPEPAFADDWVRVLDEEGKHFLLLTGRLAALDASYGDLPAHDGLWQAAEATAHDLLARLAVVPLVLEARGLDVTPAMIAKLEGVGDHESAAVLRVIYRDEIGHVAIGRRWFEAEAARRGLAPRETWQALVRQFFKGRLKAPFNDGARTAAGLPRSYYAELAA